MLSANTDCDSLGYLIKSVNNENRNFLMIGLCIVSKPSPLSLLLSIACSMPKNSSKHVFYSNKTDCFIVGGGIKNLEN